MQEAGFQDRVTAATFFYVLVGYGIYLTLPDASRSIRIVGWAAPPVIFYLLLHLLLWRGRLTWTALEGLGRILYAVPIFIIAVYTPLLDILGRFPSLLQFLLFGGGVFIYWLGAEFVLANLVGRQVHQERREHAEKWAGLNQRRFLDVLFLRFPGL